MSSSEQSSLADLLNRAKDGDLTARDRLFEKCRRYVGVVARAEVESWLQAKVDASDLVQQTMLDAHQGWDAFRGQTEGEWLAWLRQILTHNATDFVRQYGGTAKRRVSREVPIRVATPDRSHDFLRDPADPGESPSEVVLRHEREIEVADAVCQLDNDYQEVVMLRNLQRLPFDEVARRMGRSRAATQMLWMRALRKLQQILSS